jgi:hypothetical protein
LVNGLFRCVRDFFNNVDHFGHLDSAWEQLHRKFAATSVALVEDGRLLSVWAEVLGIIGVPEELMELEPFSGGW